MVCTGCLRARASVTIGENANTASKATATEGFSGDGGAAGLWRKVERLSRWLEMGREVGGGVVRGRVVQSRAWGEKQRGP